MRLYDNALAHADDSLLLMRELLDNRARAEQAHRWYLKDFLDLLIAMVRKVPSAKTLDDAEALARVYLLLGALNYFAVSGPTLKQMFGTRAFGGQKEHFPRELRRLVRLSLGR
jgi:hypothetical protein